MADQSTVAKYEILDTGMEEIDGSVVYNQVTTDWINLRGMSFQPNINYSTDGYQSSKKDYTNQKWTYESNRITGKNPITFTISIAIPKDRWFDFKYILNMGDSFGLKKLRGGFGLIEMMPGQVNGEIYVIIKGINPNESFNNGSLDLYRATITFEIVVE